MKQFRLRTVFRQSSGYDVSPEISRAERRSASRRIWALIAILIIVSAVSLWVGHMQREEERAHMLKIELMQIRSAILVFMTRYGVLPKDLKTVADVDITFTGSQRIQLLEGMRFDDQGRMVDPFGYFYTYDPTTGIVYSSAPCCRNW
ncbi:MAG: hypothetical protein WC551_12380 [Patescibacteria group bacterium]